jgi:hypothetical protein
MVTMRAIQPLLVWGPWGPIPPRANLVRRAKKIPVARVQPPDLRSWLVPSSGRLVAGLEGDGGRAAVVLRAHGAANFSGSAVGLLVGAGWVAWANFSFSNACFCND